MQSSCTASCLLRVKTFYLTFLSKVKTSHCTLIRLHRIFVNLSQRSLLLTSKLSHVEFVSDMRLFETTHLENLGICRRMTESCHVISSHVLSHHGCKKEHSDWLRQPACLSALFILSLQRRQRGHVEVPLNCNAILSLLGVYHL